MANDNDRAMSLIGYKQGNVEMALACNHPDGVVLSVGDKRIELNRHQFLCLFDMMEQFIQAKTEL